MEELMVVDLFAVQQTSSVSDAATLFSRARTG